jgi:predicted site-specific integrase-resolvase
MDARWNISIRKRSMRRSKIRDTRFLKSAEVAEALGVSKVTLKTWLRTGKIQEPARDQNNGYRLWTIQDVDRIRQSFKEGDTR